MKISRILHAGYLFTSGETQILFDPIFETPFSRNCYSFPSVQFDHAAIRDLKVDAIFISHYHDDHCSLESLNFLSREIPIYLYCLFDELADWIRELGFKKVYQLKLNHDVNVGSFSVTTLRALDAEVDSIFQIRAEGLNILNVVDSWIDDEVFARLEQQPWDLILWPFQMMRELEVLSPTRAQTSDQRLPEEHLAQLSALKPRAVVASSCQFKFESWSWYNRAYFPISYAAFKRQVHEILPTTEVIRLDPSCSIELSSKSIEPADALPWAIAGADTTTDYEYEPDLIPPATGEIADHFPDLTTEEKKVVYDYCLNTLTDKYRAFDEPDENFFSSRKVWKLTLHERGGISHNFFFEIERNAIQYIASEVTNASWRTELPLYKLHTALSSGESLTSMYFRIEHDGDNEVDLIQDPLLRCLFSGAFGSYQKAQLHHLLNR